MKTHQKILLAYFAICIAMGASISYKADRRMRDRLRPQTIEVVSLAQNEHTLLVRGRYTHTVHPENAYTFSPGTKITGMSVDEFEMACWVEGEYYYYVKFEE